MASAAPAWPASPQGPSSQTPSLNLRSPRSHQLQSGTTKGNTFPFVCCVFVIIVEVDLKQLKSIVQTWSLTFFSDQVDQAKHLNWVLKGKRWTTLLTSSNLKVKPSCRPQERGARMLLKLCRHLSMWRGTPPLWFTLFYFYCFAVVFKQSPNICLHWLQLAKREHSRSNCKWNGGQCDAVLWKNVFTDHDAYLNFLWLCWKMREEALRSFSQIKADRKLLAF